MRHLAAWLWLFFFFAGASGAANETLVEQGRRIYQDGVLTDGKALTATGAGGSDLRGERAACILCHRRSGMGGREGNLIVSPVTGPLLFSKPVFDRPRRPGRAANEVKPLRQYSRDPYDDVALGRAVRTGVDPNGRRLDDLMPRYALGETDARALIAYLRQLSATPAPGLDNGVLHLATIVTADAEPIRSRIVTDTLLAWSHAGALGGIPLDLAVWTLEGPASTWERQLQDNYRRQPVYAVISGAGRSQWSPVRDFCERLAVPCLFPVVDFAPADPGDFYSLYLSTGVPLEARLLARYVNELNPLPPRVVQIVADPSGDAAAALLGTSLGAIPSEVRRWRADAPGSAGDGLRRDDILVAWLRPAEIRALATARPDGPGTGQLLFSAQLAPPQRADLPAAWRAQARWISARSDPARVHGQGVLGLAPWLQHMKLADDDESLLAEVYAATYFFGDALARMRGQWNREFLIETLESANFARPAGSAFFSLSLARGQREAAKAGHLLGFAGPDFQRLVRIGPRITP